MGVFGTRGDRGVASTRAGSSAVWAGVLVGGGSSCRLFVVEPWVALPPFPVTIARCPGRSCCGFYIVAVAWYGLTPVVLEVFINFPFHPFFWSVD